MIAVFRHELSSYFKGITGCVFSAFLLLFAGIYTVAYNVKGTLSAFEYVFGNMAFIFILIVPVLTMRALAEEKRQQTDKLLYSLPISTTDVVLGKYFAMLVLFLVPLAVICLYPLMLRAYGDVYLPAAYGAALGFYLLGAALLAAGLFISSVTENQAVSAGLCFAVMLINYFLNSLAGFLSSAAFASLAAFAVLILLFVLILWRMTRSGVLALGTGILLGSVLMLLYDLRGDAFEGLFARTVKKLSLFERFYVFVDGTFDLTGVLYFLTVIAVLLFFSVQSMEKRRWSE